MLFRDELENINIGPTCILCMQFRKYFSVENSWKQ